MPDPRLPLRLLSASAAATTLLAAAALGAPAAGQEMDDPSRLADVRAVSVRASADWDEMITTSAGGATEEQFRQALLIGFEEALASAASGPALDAEAPDFVLCHVDTFYDSGLIVYSARVSHHVTSWDGPPLIRWLRSWVGSYTTQQLHVIWSLSDQCAEAYLEAWGSANPSGGRP